MQTTLPARKRRHARIRAKVAGTAKRPRLSVFKSNRYLYAQLIDDKAGRTLAASSAKTVGAADKPLLEQAERVGADIARKAAEQNIAKAVFDRGGFSYMGAVKKVAESARQTGLAV